MSPADGVFLLSFLFGVQKIRPWQEYMSKTDTVPRCHLGSGENPCSRRNTNIFPATDVCLTSQNTRLLPFLAPSAAHLTVCILPAFTVPARCKCTITSLLPLLRFYGRYILCHSSYRPYIFISIPYFPIKLKSLFTNLIFFLCLIFTARKYSMC